jgi:ABC-2 type transport system ATP-binding protein
MQDNVGCVHRKGQGRGRGGPEPLAFPPHSAYVAAMIPAIHVESLTKRYRETLAVDDISFSVPRGTTVGLLGGNGAGKTTTIAMLMGLLVPSSGKIHVLGHDMAKDRFSALARMNFSSPYVALPHKLTVRENLRVYAHLYSVPKPDQRIRELANELDLHALLDRPAGKLSAGQKTRVALAKSLINRPEVLLLDEPTASLDPDTGDLVRTWLEQYRAESGCTVLLASHNMAEVERLCGEVLMMKFGRIVDRGTPTDLLTRYNRDDLEEVFLDIARDRDGPGPRDTPPPPEPTGDRDNSGNRQPEAA